MKLQTKTLMALGVLTLAATASLADGEPEDYSGGRCTTPPPSQPSRHPAPFMSPGTKEDTIVSRLTMSVEDMQKDWDNRFTNLNEPLKTHKLGSWRTLWAKATGKEADDALKTVKNYDIAVNEMTTQYVTTLAKQIQLEQEISQLKTSKTTKVKTKPKSAPKARKSSWFPWLLKGTLVATTAFVAGAFFGSKNKGMVDGATSRLRGMGQSGISCVQSLIDNIKRTAPSKN